MNIKIALVSGALVFVLVIGGVVAVIMSKPTSSPTSLLPSTLSTPTPTTQTDEFAEGTPAPSSVSDSTQSTPTATPSTQPKTQAQKQKRSTMKKGVIATSKGNITVEFYPEETPKTVENFAQKAQSNFYKGLKFHRVENWVVQGGDPLGNGTGGGKIPTELSQRQFGVGSVGVARGGDIKVSNDSQFFVCTTDCSFLTGQYTNFGTVVEGMDVVKNISIGDTIQGVSILE